MRDEKTPLVVDVELADEVEVVETVEGKRVVVRAEERIEIRCGKASLILTKEGKLLINGALVSISSDGVIRIDGGSVQIN